MEGDGSEAGDLIAGKDCQRTVTGCFESNWVWRRPDRVRNLARGTATFPREGVAACVVVRAGLLLFQLSWETDSASVSRRSYG
jgi:hypothetical protein